MAGSEPDSGGVGRGKALAWRSRSNRDMTGRDAGRSASGRDIGRDIANWWSSAVEQTSTFILDEVPATFAGLSVGAKELKPTLTLSGLSAGAKELKPSLTRGSSFSSFTLPWKSTVDGSKGVEDPTPRQEGEDATMSAPEVLCKSSERSQSRTQAEQPQESPSKSVGGSHSRKQAGKACEPSTSSPKPLKGSHSRKQVEKPLSPSPKPLERSQSRKEHEKPLSPPIASPKLLERSQSRKHGEKPQEPSPKPPLEISQSRKQVEKPLSPSPKPLERSQSRKEHEKPLSPPIASPKLLERSQSRKHDEKPQEPSPKPPLERSQSRKQGEKPQEPSPKPLERSQSRKESEKPLSPSIALKPLERSQSRKHGEKPQEPSPKPPLERKQVDKAHRSSTSSPKRSPLKTMTLQVEMKYEPIVPSPKHVESPKQVSGFETPNQVGKSPLSTPKPSESSPGVTPDPRSSTGRQGESRRRTKRMAVDAAATESSPAQSVCLSTISQEFLLGEGAAPGPAKAHSLEVLQLQHFWTPQKARTDSPGEKSNPNSATKPGSSSKRSSASRSLARSLHLDRSLSPQLTAMGTPESSEKASEIRAKHVGVVLPREEIFPGKTNSLPQIRVRTPRVVESSTSLSKNPLIGGSTRVTNHEIREDSRTRLAGSLPTSPRHTSGESTTARLLRRLKFTGRGSKAGSDDSKLGKRRSAAQSGKAMTDLGPKESSDVHHDTLEPRQLDFSFMNWTEPDLGNKMLRESRAASNHGPAERSALHSGGNDASFSSRKQQGNASSRSSDKKSSVWPWTFKWKWGSKSKSRSSAKGGSKGASVPTLPPPATKTDSSPTADIMSDARDNFGSQSDRFSSAGSAEKLASDRAPKHRRVISWGADSTSALCSGSNATMAAFTPGQPRLATRDAQKLLVPPRKLFVPPNVNVERSQEQEVRRSNPGANVLRSSADTDVFEDCFGSFRSTDSPSNSFGSFRSIESPTVSSSSIRKTIDADEWDSHVSSSHRQEINDDPCTSASKFRFKCPKVQQFNKFLRAQKERLRRGLDAGNTDRFCIVLTGRDLELSSIVAAMSYAWLQENSFPKVSGDLWHPVPMIDIPRQKMDKHRDAVWLFDACGIDPGSLLFADETELSVLVGAGRIKMSIIGQDVLVTRNEVGSVCTLLMEMLLAEHRALLQPRYLKAFMLAGILVDTENLDFASIRDTEMSNLLVEGMGCFGRTSFYNQLREAEDDARVSKLIIQNYDNQPSARLKLRVEAEHEHSDRDSIFTQSQDHTSTSEAGTNSSLDEDSPRPKLKQRNSFRYSRLTPHTAPARSHRLSLPGICIDQDAQAVAHIRKAATQSGHPSSALPSYGQNHHRAKSGAFARIRKKLFFE